MRLKVTLYDVLNLMIYQKKGRNFLRHNDFDKLHFHGFFEVLLHFKLDGVEYLLEKNRLH